MVQQGLTKLLGDPLRLSAELGEGLIANEALAPSCSQLAALADDRASLGTLLGDLGARIIVRQERITIFLDPARLCFLAPDIVTAILEGRQPVALNTRSEEHTSELQSLVRISYAVFCLTKKTTIHKQQTTNYTIH